MSPLEMSPLEIALIVLIVAGIWAVIELAFTMRSSRKSLRDISVAVTETAEEVKPVVQKLDGVVDELQQASKQLEPLLDKTSTAVDALTVTLVRADEILEDVSTVTSTGAQLSGTVNKLGARAVSGVSGLFEKISSSAKQGFDSAKQGFDHVLQATSGVTPTGAASATPAEKTNETAPAASAAPGAAATSTPAAPPQTEKSHYFTYPSTESTVGASTPRVNFSATIDTTAEDSATANQANIKENHEL